MGSPKHSSAQHQEQVQTTLREAGFSEATAAALVAMDTDHFQYVRRVMKGDVPQTLMQELNARLESTQFQALTSILRIQNGYGRARAQEVTVGLLAEEMNLDPSRASRIAADLVERGLVARTVSQQDGRRSVLVTTEAARVLLESFLRAKWQKTIRLFSTWSEADIMAFADLFGRYVQGMREQYPPQG